MVSADEVARYIICYFQERGQVISTLTLQHLLYYCQVWRLGLYGEELFPEKFQAWITGPVQPEIHRHYRGCGGYREIDEPVECPELSEDIREHLNEVLTVYEGMTCEDCTLSSHHDALRSLPNPWEMARVGRSRMDAGCEEIIKTSDMEEFYTFLGAPNTPCRIEELKELVDKVQRCSLDDESQKELIRDLRIMCKRIFDRGLEPIEGQEVGHD